MSDNHTNQVPLHTIKSGLVQLAKIECPDKEKTRRFMEMGFCNQCSIEICKHCNHLKLCKIRGYCLAIRTEDAKHFKVFREGAD